MNQGSDQEQFATIFPILQSEGFESQFGFFKAEGHFDFPPSGIKKDDASGILVGKKAAHWVVWHRPKARSHGFQIIR